MIYNNSLTSVSYLLYALVFQIVTVRLLFLDKKKFWENFFKKDRLPKVKKFLGVFKHLHWLRFFGAKMKKKLHRTYSDLKKRLVLRVNFRYENRPSKQAHYLAPFFLNKDFKCLNMYTKNHL